MKPLGYFSQFPQGEAFVSEFGDYDADKLPAIDQCALSMVLTAFCYHCIAKDKGLDQGDGGYDAPTTLQEVAEIHIPCEYDYTTDKIGRAIEILEGINIDQAIGLIAFLSQ